ncbi:hypothetical protein FHL15_007449 [Xylaria flabelliformis]|uniref:Uncharacterized protein n=1 Tax=Xylaria flabelliformis TaxID=2512241 RepID=A0A553HUN6_9PEZI|nr:hypothetical protein FHL15_007449 [Xylaria flabelliformis]
MSALRFAGYDIDYRTTATPPASTTMTKDTTDNAAAVSAGGRYMHALPADVEPARALLEQYSGVPSKDVDRHVYQMRDKLWDVYPYACVGRFRFASLEFAADAYYQVALFRLLQAQTEEDETRLLDVGCCVGQVLRKLAFDGVDSSRLFGTDVEPRFLDIGYDLFRDRNKFKGGFVIGDILKQQNQGGEEGGDALDALDALDAKMTFIHATSFFHLFTWDDQVRAAARMVRFLHPDRRDVMLFGRQVGTMLPRDNGKAGSDKVYLHNADSWQRLWDEVGQRTGTRWKTTMEPTEKIETGATESSLRKMTFCVLRA